MLYYCSKDYLLTTNRRGVKEAVVPSSFKRRILNYFYEEYGYPGINKTMIIKLIINNK